MTSLFADGSVDYAQYSYGYGPAHSQYAGYSILTEAGWVPG